MIEQDLVGLSELRFAVVNKRSRVVLSVHYTIESAIVEVNNYNKAIRIDDEDIFGVVELSRSVIS